MPEEYRKTPPEDVPPEHHDRARELQLELVVLEARLESANFEDKEAYRRAIRNRREELDSLRESTPDEPPARRRLRVRSGARRAQHRRPRGEEFG